MQGARTLLAASYKYALPLGSPIWSALPAVGGRDASRVGEVGSCLILDLGCKPVARRPPGGVGHHLHSCSFPLVRLRS